ncbi:sensor histidine kinase [Salidesulfovibrio brasiliensis]|uniref:sensor histidine kinase n=1 Tax=Salidesulfovibrio brasiliensis TaxID=221711 RepID=UPI0006CF3181|nr:ATP-binding protein [Salidesulfovibrio brasiliensis]
MDKHTDRNPRPLQSIKVLSWSIFTLILGFSLLLSIFLSERTERSLLKKQEQFGLLLAENVSHQVWTRFALPVLIRYGSIKISDPEQFKRLDQVVRSTIHSFKVTDLRICDAIGDVTYSLKEDELGKPGPNITKVRDTWSSEQFTASIDSNVSKIGALFSIRLKPGTIVMTSYYPLRAESNLSSITDNPIMGILEISQDITDEYMEVINFERLIISSSLLSSMVLFFVIITLLGRADRINNQRIQEKQRLERELLQQEKLAGMGRMVSGVAHEIRNPLGIICSTSELLTKKAEKTGGDTRLISALHEEAKRLSRTVTEFLDYARPKQPTMMDVNLCRLLEQIAVFLEPEFEKLGITVHRDCPDDLITQGDKDLLYRALYNLVSNAAQAMNGPGELFINAEQDAADDTIRITIRDTGPGFDTEHMDKYRDPFFTTKDTGTGLGLAIVSNILESHHATLDLENAPEGGARVTATFKGSHG